MNEIQLSLTRLIGKNEHMATIIMDNGPMGIKQNTCTLSDFHRWMNSKYNETQWVMGMNDISIEQEEESGEWIGIKYNSSKDLLEQSDDILKQIVSLVKERSL